MANPSRPRSASRSTSRRPRKFRTKRQPLGVTLGANPPIVTPGDSTTLAGTLTGTNNANRDIVLQSNPFPYSQGFVNAGNPLVTDAAGNFSFPILSVPVTTQFRVLMPQRPEIASPVVTVGAALQVTTRTKKVARHRHCIARIKAPRQNYIRAQAFLRANSIPLQCPSIAQIL